MGNFLNDAHKRMTSVQTRLEHQESHVAQLLREFASPNIALDATATTTVLDRTIKLSAFGDTVECVPRNVLLAEGRSASELRFLASVDGKPVTVWCGYLLNSADVRIAPDPNSEQLTGVTDNLRAAIHFAVLDAMLRVLRSPIAPTVGAT